MTTTVFAGGRIHTGAGERPDWVLVRNEVIEAAGSGDAPRADRAVDLDGAVLVPAFRDAHAHLPATGLFAGGMDFRGERSTASILDAFAARVSAGTILFGGNFEEPMDASITRHDLDRVVGERPAMMSRADMHSCIVSTALLDRLDVSELEGVDRTLDGAPTGYLRERAASEAWRWFDSSLTGEQQRDAVLGAVKIAYSRGIAEVHEMFVVEWRGWDSAERFLETIRSVSLNVPVYLGTDEVERVHQMGFPRIGGDWFLDGSFGSHTAWMRNPFESPAPPGSPATGISYRTDDDLYDMFRRAHELGMQVGVHAIGDAAIDQALRCWERVAEGSGVESIGEIGHRVEHFECAWDTEIDRAARLGLRISVQPAFDRFWGGEGGLYAERIGWERASKMNRFNAMLRAGLTLGGGSDSTVTPLDPFLQMAALRDHKLPDQSVDAGAALALMTRGPARLAAMEGERGLVAPGHRAELALLDRDPLEVDPEELLKTEVLGTWVRGARVWPEKEAEAS